MRPAAEPPGGGPPDEWLLGRLADGLSGFAPTRIRVACSGGPDSVALLHLLSRLPRARAIGLEAVHVDHRMHASSRDWVRHCRRFCADHRVPLEVLTVDPGRYRAEGPEAAARRARYAALAAGSTAGTLTATAHHREDLAETLLMRLLRGSGPSGLAGIPPRRRLGAGWLWRPLLEVPRDLLRDYVRRHALPFVSDPSNDDPRLDRGFLRREVMPVLRRRWREADGALARAAAHQSAAHGLLQALAVRDCAAAVDERGTFSIAATRGWAAARTANALRCWLAERGLPPPSSAQLGRIDTEVIDARDDAVPLLRWPGAELRRFRGRLYAQAPLPPVNPRIEQAWRNLAVPLALDHGMLRAEAVRGEGVCARRIAAAPLVVRLRRGGERVRSGTHGPPRALKRLLQELAVPPWERERLPLLYAGERLVALAGRWVAGDFAAASGEAGWRIRWHPEAR